MRDNGPVTNHEVLIPEDEPLVSRTDPGGRIVFVNEAFVKISGFERAELIGAPHNIVRHPGMPKQAFADLWSTVKAGRPWEGLVKNRTKTGDFYWVRANVTPVIEAGKLEGFVSIRSRPSRPEVAAAEAAYARLRRGDSRGIGLRDGKLVATGLVAAWREHLASVRMQLAITLGIAMLSLALSAWLGRTGRLGYAAHGTADMDGGSEAFVWWALLLCAVALQLMQGLMLLRGITRTVEELGAGFAAMTRNDLSQAIQIPAAREFWQLGASLRALRARLFYNNFEQAEKGRQTAAARREAVQEMAASVEAESRRAVGKVVKDTAAIAQQLESMALMASRVSENAIGVNQAAGNALSNAQSVGAASEELSSSIREIAGQVARSTEITQRAVASGELAQERIRSLNDAAIKIGDVVRLIRGIADRTNLLALNATIEATRAGDAGRGFNVVATEVKSLAAQTQRSTEEIARQVSAIQEATTSAVDVVGQASQAIREIATVSAAIASAVDLQAAATQEISRNVSESLGAMQSVSERIGVVSQDATASNQRADEIRVSAATVASSVDELQVGITRIIRTTTTDADRRLGQRVKVRLPCEINIGGKIIPCEMTEMNFLGASVTCKSDIAAGNAGILRLTQDGVSAGVTVKERHADGGMVLTFDSEKMTPEFSRRRDQLLDSAQAEAA